MRAYILTILLALQVQAKDVGRLLAPPISEVEVQNLFRLLGTTADSALLCTNASTGACSFAEACQQLPRAPRGLHLFTNEQGRRYPTPEAFNRLYDIRSCGMRAGGPLALPSPPTAYDQWLSRASETQRRGMRSAMEQVANTRLGDVLEKGIVGADRASVEASVRTAVARLDPPLSSEDALAVTAAIPLAIDKIVNPPYPQVDWSKVPPHIREAFEDPFLNPYVLNDESASGDRARALVARRQAEMKSLIEATRARLLRVLENRKEQLRVRGGEIAAQLTGLESMILRIKTIKVNAEVDSYCAVPNAFYRARDHQFTFCPQTLDIPEAALMDVIAHEMGHAIDPCNVSGDLERFAGATAPMHSRHPFRPPIYTEAGEVITRGVSAANNPYRGALECLTRTAVARPSSITGLQDLLAQQESERARRAGLDLSTSSLEKDMSYTRGRINSANAVHAGVSNIHRHPYCNEYGSQHQESFAELVTAEVLALDPAPSTALVDYLGPFIQDCYTPEELTNANRELDQLMTDLGCTPAPYSFPPMLSTHLSSQTFVDRIWLAHPTLRERFGCEPLTAEGNYCAQQL